MNLLHLFDLSLIDCADEVALEWAGKRYTFGEIEARSNRAAHALLARGFEQGDRLCVYLANRIELVDLYLACVKLGVIFVPINVLYREREIAHIVGDAAPRLVVDEGNVHEVASGQRPAEKKMPRAVGRGPRARSTATRPRRSSTPRARPVHRRARFSRTTTSLPTR